MDKNPDNSFFSTMEKISAPIHTSQGQQRHSIHGDPGSPNQCTRVGCVKQLAVRKWNLENFEILTRSPKETNKPILRSVK